ncbi:MAG: glycosyltransferase [Planctomycetes bacterium]|nr:glycosyltransferase [Planctomycetota bacterium]
MPRRAKVLYWDLTQLGSGYPNGIARFIVAMAEREYGFPNTFLLPPWLEDGGLHRALSSLPGRSIVMHRFPRRRYPWRWYLEQMLDDPGILLAPANVNRPTRMPTVLVVHDLIPYDDADYAGLQNQPIDCYRAIVERATVVVAASDYTASRITHRFPSVQRIRRVDHALFPEPAEAVPTHAPTCPYYLFVGGAENRKRLEDAVSLATALDDAALVVVGGDFVDRTVGGLCAAWPGRMPLVTIPHCTDAEMVWWFRHCRALLYPTRMEGFGLPALECLRAGRPVVARPLSSLPEVLGSFALWHDFSVSDANGLERLRVRIGQWTASSALTTHLTRYSWNRSRDALAKIIDEVVDTCA